MPGPEVRLSAAIMTHPAREDRARKLAEALPELDAAIVVDEPGGPGRGNLGNALRAWARIGADATHHLVLQDDVVPCEDFTARLRRAVRARPDDAVSLFCEWGSRSANLVRAAARRGWGWARAVDMYTPSQGLVMPREAAIAFAGREDTGGADDLALAEFLRRTGRANAVTVPNLLDHDDRMSLTANGFQGPRLTVCLAGDAEPDFDTPVAGDALVRLPYASWMRVHAEWFYCGERHEDYTWLGDFADTRLPEGLRKADLAGPFRADLDAADPALTASVSELALFEYWTTYLALGLVQPSTTDTLEGPYAEAAFATAFPGLFRRYLPGGTVEALRGPAGALASAAFDRGAAIGIARPHPDWHTEETAA
jgi:hypothetical protein